MESGSAQSGDGKVFVAWDDLKPTYRGREKKDATPLDLKSIKRFTIMIRRYDLFAFIASFSNTASFFGSQEGDFSLSILSIAASTKHSKSVSDSGELFTEPYKDDPKGATGAHGECMSVSRGGPTARECFGSCIVS